MKSIRRRDRYRLGRRPSLGFPVGMLKVNSERAAANLAVVIDIRGQLIKVRRWHRENLIAGGAGDFDGMHENCTSELRNRRRFGARVGEHFFESFAAIGEDFL